MARLGEGLRITTGAVADSVGASGLKTGWDTVRSDHHGIKSVPIAAAAGVLAVAETFMFPNSMRDFLIEDNVSTYSRDLKTSAAITASMVLDGLSYAGAVGVWVLTQSFEATIAAKTALNAVTSVAVRTADSIRRQRPRTVTV